MPEPLRRALGAALAALSLGACAGRVTPAGPLSAGAVSQYARVLAIADARRPDSVVLYAAMRDGAPPVRAAAALAIGQVHLRTAAPALRPLLHDADTAVAARAAFSLGLLRDTASVASLDSALAAGSIVGAQAAFALGEIGEPARNVIVARLDGAEPGVRAELLLAAAKLRPVPAERVVAALSSDDPCVRWAAAYALARPRVAAGVSALIAMLDDARVTTADSRQPTAAGRYECAPSEIRAQIARALVRPATGDSLAPRAIARLRALVRDPAPHVRVNALRAFATFGDSSAPPLVTAARDTDANVRIAAAQALSGRRLADDLWAALWRTDTSLMYRRSLLESATRAGSTLPAHAEWRAAADWRMRAALADAAALAPSPARGTELATPLLADRDPRVRQSAVGAVTAFLDSTGGAQRRATVLGALTDPDFFVRATALLALADSARASEVPAVLASYRLAARDSGNDARIAAIRYVASAWKRDSAAFPDSVRRAVSALESPDDPLVRAEARGVPMLAAWPGTEGTARDRGWYESVVRDYVAPTLAGAPWHARIESARGVVTLELLGVDAPQTVENFVRLARSGFYRNVRFHRVVPNFVAQDGDPRGDGNGGPGYAIRDELNLQRYVRGAVGMALSGPDTGGSQYFLTLSPQPHLDARYTIFARVVDGFDAMDRLVQGDAISNIVIGR
ncbi:MAG TPA: peptidylprolyl isomerase [Gemmatimonadaceae bacterium]|nr:peptidylprolyl isomerase [Gemmatimonadaceae bacterium]